MGAPVISFSGTKIKGGKWTVSKFFLLSVAYTAVWLAVSSDLGYYRSLYGPQILLQLNISYYVPSIPILIFQSFFDERLEARFGISRTILARLVISLAGYAILCASFPFMPQELWYLLVTVVLLGAFSSIAFSASYQMVSRFANKNVIALGLGCTASGPIILLFQITLGMKSTPTQQQQIMLYFGITALVLSGLWAAISLLFRHWDALNASSQHAETASRGMEGSSRDEGGVQEPLLSGEPSVNEEGVELMMPAGSSLITSRPSTPLGRHPSLPPALAYSLLEPYKQPYLTAREEWSLSQRQRTSSPEKVNLARRSIDVNGGGVPEVSAVRRTTSAPSEWHINRWGSGRAADDIGNDSDLENELASNEESIRLDEVEGGVTGMIGAIRLMWPALIAIGLQSGIALTVFPFFTYLPSSGLLGEDLPKVLFFGRIFADIAGRLLPRARMFVPSSIVPVITIAGCKLFAEPLFFIYLKTSEEWHSDVLVVLYVVAMWAASGYVNTAANMVAPRMVPPHMKSTAAGLMAIVYQLGHFVGLSVAVVLAYLLYGHTGTDH